MKAVHLAKIVGLNQPTSGQQQEYEQLNSLEKSIHMKAVEIMNGVGGQLNWEILEQMATLIDSGGYIGSSTEERAIYTQIRLHRIEMLKTKRVAMSLPTVDDVSETNVCHKEVEHLSECFLTDLLTDYKGRVAIDRVLWLETVEPAFKTSCAVQLCVTDKSGSIVTLSLYHYLKPGAPDALLETLFPVGTKFGLFNPYLKCSNVGRLALRNDNPGNVKLVIRCIDEGTSESATARSRPADPIKASTISNTDLENQRMGLYDFATLSFDPYNQDHIADYYGPIQVRSAGRKGRGLFVSRDVAVGELLFAEKAFAFRAHDEDHILMATNYDTRRVNKGSQYNLVSDILIKIHEDSHSNSILSYLQTDFNEANDTIPNLNQFLLYHESVSDLPIKPRMSAKQVDGAIYTNAHEFDIKPSPTVKDRQQLCSSLSPGVDKDIFLNGLQYRAKAKKIYQTLQKNKKESGMMQEHSLSGGMALWIIGSFMNHESLQLPNTVREVFGNMLFVYALCPMKAGDEITTTYSDDVNALKNGWGIPAL